MRGTAAVTGRRRLVFVGAGHAHLYALKRCRRYVERGHECVLVAPGPFWYSGLATGVLGGRYPPELDRIDVGALLAAGGGRFIRDRVTALDPAEKTITVGDGYSLDYDVLGLNAGSRTPDLPGEREHPEICYAAKPVERLVELRDRLVELGDAARRPRIVVAGGGPTAFELAANLLGLAGRIGARFDISVVAGDGRMLAQLPARAAESVVEHLRRRGLRVIHGRKVARVVDGAVLTDAGDRLDCEFFVNATGLRPAPLAREAGLPVDEHGAMLVDEHLRSIGRPEIFGGGDLVQPASGPIDRVGVHAIRQAPVLMDNTLAAMDRKPPARTFRPQDRYLWIMNLGDGSALAARGRWWFRGRPAFWLKDWIDRRFLRRSAAR